MRFRSLLIGDIKFQYKYGFYYLYLLLAFLFAAITNMTPASFKSKTAAIIIFTDPATLGIFFMGAIILLEKSQRVLDSLAVAPIKIWEYIGAKVISLSIISTAVGIVLTVVSGSSSIFIIASGTFLGSVLFTLLGISIAAKTSSLNSFIIATIPAMLCLLLPGFFELFGYESSIFNYHPGNSILRLVSGNSPSLLLELAVILPWIAFFYIIAYRRVTKMLKTVGGIKL